MPPTYFALRRERAFAISRALASSDPEMWRDICVANARALRKELAAYRAELDRFDALLAATDGAALAALFERARTARDAWLARSTTSASDPTASDPMELPRPRARRACVRQCAAARIEEHFQPHVCCWPRSRSGTTRVEGLLDADDVDRMLEALRDARGS